MQNSLSYFPRPKDMPGLRGWDAAVNSLAVNLALEERWYYDDADKQNRPILKNYLSFTFQRLQYEDNWRKRRLLRITDNHDSKFSKISCMQFGILDL